MLGASALCGLAAMRAGAGLVTLGVPRSLNLTLQRKISAVLMTLPLPETTQHTFATRAWAELKKNIQTFSAVAIGPGLSGNLQTRAFIKQILLNCPVPLVIDADALNAVSESTSDLLFKSKAPRILTPHAGEFHRLLHTSNIPDEKNLKARSRLAQNFAKRYHCVLLLKGHQTIVADLSGACYINTSGNSGMATAGSGDVLTGILTAFLAQGIPPFEAAKWAAYLHGKAGDLAAKAKGKASLIATDLIESLPNALKNAGKRTL